MDQYFKEWNGEKYPVRLVPVDEEEVGFSPVAVADYELWKAIEHDYEHKDAERHSEAVAIDNEIYYYCDSGFIAGNPSDEEIIRKLVEAMVITDVHLSKDS